MTDTVIAPTTALSTLTDRTFHDGLAAGMRLTVDPALPLPRTASGYTFVPAGHCGGTDEVVEVVPHRLARSEGLELVRLVGGAGAQRRPDYSLPLVAVRLGLSHRMLDLAVAHLNGRRGDGAPLTTFQLVQASIADVATALETCRHALRTATPGADAGWLHARLEEADRVIAMMFGAAGYLFDHPVRCLHLVTLIRDAWVAAPEHAGVTP